MNAKWKTALYCLTACLPLFVMLAVLPRLPETLPMQYNFSGGISRMGSRNELLLLPLITIMTAAGMRLLARLIVKFPRGEHNRKALDFTSWAVVIFLGIISFVMLYYAGRQTQDITQTRAVQILSLMISLLFVVLGNILPKCKRTGRFWLNIGFRTPWTLRSDMVWSKVNRLGGYGMVGAGLVGIAVSLLVGGLWSLIIVIGLMLIVVIWGIVYSWRLYRGEERDS